MKVERPFPKGRELSHDIGGDFPEDLGTSFEISENFLQALKIRYNSHLKVNGCTL